MIWSRTRLGTWRGTHLVEVVFRVAVLALKLALVRRLLLRRPATAVEACQTGTEKVRHCDLEW